MTHEVELRRCSRSRPLVFYLTVLGRTQPKTPEAQACSYRPITRRTMHTRLYYLVYTCTTHILAFTVQAFRALCHSDEVTTIQSDGPELARCISESQACCMMKSPTPAHSDTPAMKTISGSQEARAGLRTPEGTPLMCRMRGWPSGSSRSGPSGSHICAKRLRRCRATGTHTARIGLATPSDRPP